MRKGGTAQEKLRLLEEDRPSTLPSDGRDRAFVVGGLGCQDRGIGQLESSFAAAITGPSRRFIRRSIPSNDGISPGMYSRNSPSHPRL